MTDTSTEDILVQILTGTGSTFRAWTDTEDRLVLDWLDPDGEVIAVIGAKEGLSHFVLVTVGPGDVVLAPDPTYPIHQYSVIIAGGDLRHVPLTADSDFIANLEQAIHRTWPKPKMLILSFPANPTTRVVDLAAEISLTRNFRAELELGQSLMDTFEDALAVFSAAGVLTFCCAASKM